MEVEFTKILAEVISEINKHERELMFPAPQLPPDYTPTERIVHKMLIENTGAHILDSGDIYGRNWERNRMIKNFRKIPKVSVDVWSEGVSVYYNVFHYIVDHCEYDPKLDREFHQFANSPEWEKEPWLVCMEGFVEEHLGLKEGWEWNTTNTYNYENILSQVLQFVMFTPTGDFYDSCYVILQTHNGCDVRGGYSTPHVFRVHDHDYFWLAQRDIYASCQKCGYYWMSDDAGYHWWGEGCSSNDNSDLHEWKLIPEDNIVRHKDCGGLIEFIVTEG